MKYYIFLGFLAVIAAYPYGHEEPKEEKYDFHEHIGETGHHHEVEHEHAKSHQSIKFEHFHPVPVYVKKEDSHLLKHPIEKGNSESKLKLIHPKTEHSHGDGLVLEDERHHNEHHVEHEFEHGGFEHGGFEHGGFDHHSGGFEGFDGSEGQGYAELAHQHEAEGNHFAEAGHSPGDADEGYKFNSY